MLEFLIEAKNKKHFSKTELEASKVMVHFTLFDQEVKVETVTKMKEIRYMQNRYLGSFKLPLTTIMTDMKFEGLIKINRPIVLQDYVVV